MECSGNGVCNSKGKCECNSEYSGNSCELKGCPNECTSESHGTCDYKTGKCTCIDHFYGDDCAESYCPPYYNSTNSCYSDNEQGLCDKSIGVCACNFKYNNNLNVVEYDGYYADIDCSVYVKDTASSKYEKVVLNDFEHASDPIRLTKTIKYHQYQYFETEITSASYSIYIIIDNIKPANYLTASSESPLLLYASFIHDPPSGVRNQYIANYNASTLVIEMVPGVDNSPFTTIGTIRFSVVELVKKENDDAEDCSYDIYVIQDPCQDENYKKCNGNGECKNGKCECTNPAFTGSQCNILNCNPMCVHGTCINTNTDFDNNNNTLSNTITVDDLKCECDGGYIGDSCNENDPNYLTPPVQLTFDKDAIITPSVLVDVGYYSLFQFEVTDENKIIIFHINFADIITMSPIILFKYKKYPKVNDYDIFSSTDWSIPKNNVTILLDASKGLISGTWYLSIYNSLYSTTKLDFTMNLYSPTTQTEYNNICTINKGYINMDNSNQPSCNCITTQFYEYTGDFCDEEINIIQLKQQYIDIDLEIGSYYYMKIDVKSSVHKYLMVNITNNVVDSEVLLLVSNDQLPRLDRSAYYDEYSVSVDSSSQEVIMEITTSTNFIYITVYNKITSKKATKITCYIKEVNSLVTYSEYERKMTSLKQQYEIKEQLKQKLSKYKKTTKSRKFIKNNNYNIINSVNSLTEICNTSDSSLLCNKYSRDCYYRGIYQDSSCNCLSNWNGVNCNTPVLRSIQMLMFSAQNIKILCNKCEYKMYLKRGSFNLYIIPLPLRETDLSINVFGVDKNGEYSDSLNNDADILISKINPRTLYDFSNIIAYNSNNETFKITSNSNNNNNNNNKIYLAIYANTNGYYNISVSVNEDNTVDTGDEILNELVDWIGKSGSGIVSLIFVILFLLLPICCLCFPICSKDEIIRLDMGKIVSNYITSNTSNNTNNTTKRVNKNLDNAKRREELRRKKKNRKSKRISNAFESKTVVIEMTPFTFNEGESPVPYLYILNGEYRVVNPPRIELLKNPLILKQAENAII